MTYKKLLGKFEQACIDLTPLDDELKIMLLEPTTDFNKFLERLHQEKTNEIGYRVAANQQINLLKAMSAEERRASLVQEPLIRGIGYTTDISSLHLMHN